MTTQVTVIPPCKLEVREAVRLSGVVFDKVCKYYDNGNTVT